MDNSSRSSNRSRTRIAGFTAWLPPLVLLPFLILFLLSVFPRLTIAQEIEWNEGQTGEQALRFAWGQPLYPAPEEGWVPYMYAPLYHMVFGVLLKVSGFYTLGWGRLISFAATVATALAVLTTVWDRTRRIPPALAAVFLYLAYYKATGYWYDLARVDSLALAFAAWGMHLTQKRRVALWEAVLGAVLFVLGALTKQPIAVLGVVCLAQLLLRSPRGAIVGGLVALLLTANFAVLFIHSGNSHFVHYTFVNALEHLSRTNHYFPGDVTAAQFVADLRPGEWAVLAYLRGWAELGAPRVWQEAIRHVWLAGLLVLAAVVACTVRRRLPRSLLYLLPGVVLAWSAFSAYGKFGGYVNNFQSLYLWLSIAVGLSLADLEASWRGWKRPLVPAAVALVLALQVYQPWNIPGAVSGEAGGKGSFRYHIARLNHAGLTYFPSTTRPSAGSRKAYEEFMLWLIARGLANEPVWVLHHHWYALVAGHPPVINMDMVRVATWAYDPVPPELLAELQSGRWKYLVADSESLQYEWLPPGAAGIIQLNYVPQGRLELYQHHDLSTALAPVSGAPTKPLFVYRLKGAGGVAPAER